MLDYEYGYLYLYLSHYITGLINHYTRGTETGKVPKEMDTFGWWLKALLFVQQ